jgi:hypothetical protein
MPTTTTLRRTIAAGLAAALALVATPTPAHALDPPLAFCHRDPGVTSCAPVQAQPGSIIHPFRR